MQRKVIYVAQTKEFRVKSDNVDPFGMHHIKIRPRRLKSYNPVLWESTEMKELKEEVKAEVNLPTIPEKHGKCIIL
jgi:hypothetical protein